MTKKPEDDEFAITDADVAGLGVTDPARAAPDASTLPVDATEATPAPETKDSDAAFEASESLQQQLAELKKLNEELEAETERRNAELAKTREALEAESQKANQVQTQLSDSRIQTVANMLAANEISTKDAKARYAEAMSEGDWTKAADVQQEMADLSVKKQRLEEGRNALESELERAKDAPRVAADPVQGFIDQLPAEQREWANAHKEWFQTPAKNAKVVAAHYEAVTDEGLREGSRQYFDYIERKLGLKTDPDQSQPQQPRSASAPAAPPSRGSVSMATGSRSNSGGKFRLSPSEVEAARISGVSNIEYYQGMTPEQQAAARARVN